MKKIFTLFTLLTCFLGVKAEWVEDYRIDYSQEGYFTFAVLGYVPEWNNGVMTDLGAMYKYVPVNNEEGLSSNIIVPTDPSLEDYYRIQLDEPEWHQYIIADGIPTECFSFYTNSFTVKAMVRASEPCTINVNMGWGWGDGEEVGADVSIGTQWQEVEWNYSGIAGYSCHLVAQPGTETATIEWKYLVVSHDANVHGPIEWTEMLDHHRDAETPWADANVRFDDQDNNYKICAWGKEKGRNMNDDGGWDPFPADIEEVDGSHVFVCHGQPATTEGSLSAWDNQFWIQSPQAWKTGTPVKISFRYKASKNVTCSTQVHTQNPCNYLIWHAIGDVNFTEEWQEFEKVLTWQDDMDGGWSIAFNLNEYDKEAINFYFDDLSWSKMKMKPNPAIVVVNGEDRDELEDTGGSGQTCDNGFFIVANRALKAGEETIIEFDYSSSVDANTTTQCHIEPGTYIHDSAIGDVNFTTSEQHFAASFTVPSEADGMRSIAFNMAEIKDACNYTIKNIVWKLADESQTLIYLSGEENFYVKEGANDSPHVFTYKSPVLTANNYTLEYGDPLPQFGYTPKGPAITGSPVVTCDATQYTHPPVGTYTINISQGSVVDPNNEVTYVNGTLTITEAPLTIWAKNYTIWKGDPLPTQATLESDLTYNGFKNGETVADLTTPPTVSCAATDSNTPGSYDITVSGATSSNYSITEVGGALNIREKEGMADDGNGIYMPWGQNSPWQMTYVYQSQDTGTPPDADWYKTTFDDSGWGLMTGPVDRASSPHFGLGSFFDVPDEGSALYLRRTFNIDATEYANMPDPLIMKFTVDDRVDVYLNDKLLGTNQYSDGTCNFEYTLTIAKSYLVTGTNVLALYYHDENGEAYLDYQLMSSDPSTVSPYTDNQGITYELNNTQTAWAVTGMNWNENQTSIDIPGSQFGLPVTTVNENVFNGHGYITSITLNEGLTTIQGWAFYGTGITSINIPASVTKIFTDHDNYGNYQPANPFGGCSKLATITVDANNTVYSSPTGSNAIIETATNKLVVGCKGTDMAKLPNVTEIGYAAFHDLSGMTEFTIPSNITTIGEGAFWGCSDLSAVTVESTTPINISGMSYPPFDGTKKYKLYVPVGTKALYQAADGWNEFMYIWEIGETETYPAQGYAYFDASTGTLTFTCDDQYLSHGNAKVFLDVVNGDPNYDGLFEWSSDWDTYYNVNTVVFDPLFANVKPTSTSRWFAYMENLTSIQGIEYLNTTEVTTMRHMFYQCRQLSSIDVSKFNTSKVTDMSHMFRECSSLTSLDLRNFDTSNVVDFGEMFKECSSLSNLDISSFVTSSAEDMEEMFRDCPSLSVIDLSRFNVTNVTDMHYMFYNCSGLTSLTLPKEMDKLINFSSPCYNVGQWGSAPCLLVVPSDFNFNGVNISQSPFCWADGYFNSSWEAYAELDANSKLTFYFDDQRGNRTGTTYDIDGSYIGNGATSVAFDKSFANYLPSSTAQWFKNMTALTSISGLENLITWNVYDMNEMFSGCSSLESIDMSNFDVSNAVANGYTSHMFYGCSGLKELSVSESMCDLASDACDGVGTTTEPCELNVPENFDFQGVNTTGAYFEWKTGYFKLATEETITITSAGMATYCSRRDLDFSKVTDFKAYIATGYNRTTGNVIVQPVNDAPAGTGLYLKGAPGTYKVPYAPSGSYYVNMLVGVTEPTTITPTDGDLSNLLLRKGSQGLGFYGFTNETYTVGANKAYLQIPTSMMPTAGANYIGLEFEEGMTGIDTSSMVGEATEGWFSIDGRKLNGKPTRKGVYVNNGRKIVIK